MNLMDSCENEWLCAQIVKAFGIPVANASIKHFEDVKVLVVERFDRQWSKDKKWLMRLPQEDLCQALGVSPNLKYEADGGPGIIEIMQLLLGSKNAVADREMFFRSQILFVTSKSPVSCLLSLVSCILYSFFYLLATKLKI